MGYEARNRVRKYGRLRLAGCRSLAIGFATQTENQVRGAAVELGVRASLFQSHNTV